MHWAAYGGQLGALQVLEGHDNNLLLALDNDHSTALHLAAAHGDLGVVKWLVSGSLIFSTTSHLTSFMLLLTLLLLHLSLSPHRWTDEALAFHPFPCSFFLFSPLLNLSLIPLTPLLLHLSPSSQVGRGMDLGARDHRNKTPKDVAKERKWQDIHLYLKQHQSPSKRNRPVSVSGDFFLSPFFT